MATKKDLVEAHSFSRRRLVTAFVSGAPGGREVEPARPGRTIVGGIALAILLVAGAAVAGVFNSRVEVDWDQAGIVQDKDTGDLFVILPDASDTGISGDEPRVRGIVNVTSARLILGSEEELQSVPHDEVAEELKGATIGIPGAPSAPAADSLVQSGWSACTADGQGVQVALSTTDRVTPAPTTPFTVKAGDDYYVIAEADGEGGEPHRAHAYPIPDDASDAVTSLIGAADRDSAIPVPPAFVDLFPPGGTLDETGLGLQDIGEDAPDGPGVPAKADIGDTFELGDGVGVFTQDGPSSEISPFAEAVLEAATQSRRGDFESVRRDVDSGELDLQTPPYRELSSWPTDVFDPNDAAAESDPVCAVLQPSSDQVPVILLGTDPVDEASPEGVGRSGSDVYVDTGSGAVVVSAGMDSTSGSTAVLLDDRGYAYDLVGSAVTNLGYGDLALPVVPQSWTQLFEEGTPLSRDAALCPPALGEAPGCD